MPDYSYDKDFPFSAFITNLGKYNEGELVGEWVKFPTTHEELQKVFERISIGKTDDFGQPYEEWFITDYDCYVGGLYDKLGEYENLDELNYLASKLDEMDRGEYNQFLAAMEVGGHSGSLQEIINLTENLDCYDIYPEIENYDDLGRYYIDELDAMQVPEHLRNYIDYEAYGRDVALEEGGDFTEFGYVRDTGSSFTEIYDGDRENIPEEYRIMSGPDEEELTEADKLDMATDLAFDLDEFFRAHDRDYAGAYPDPHEGKERLADLLLEGKLREIDARLSDLGQTEQNALPINVAEYKASTGYEEYLDIDTDTLREAIQNPDASRVDEMLASAEKAEREYAAEAAAFVQTPESILEQVRAVYGDRMHPNDADWAEAVSLAAACDDAFREYTFDYNHFFPKEDVQQQALADTILQGDTAKIKTGLINMGREEGVEAEVAPLIARLDAFEKECGIDAYMVYQLKEGAELRYIHNEALDSLKQQGVSVVPENYELVYAAQLTPDNTLEKINIDLNLNRPDDFKGHSLSISDIVVLRQNGQDTAHYCDRFGFTEVPEFLDPAYAPDRFKTAAKVSTPRGSFSLTDMSRQQMEAAGYGFHHQSDDGHYLIMANGTRAFAIRSEQMEKDNPLRTAEMTLEDDYGMIDGIINNGRRGEEMEKAKEAAAKTEPQEKPSIMERLADAKRECADHKLPDKASPQKKPPELGSL